MTILLGCTVWIPLMLWISALVHWMIGGEIEIPSGILGIAAGLGLGVVCLSPPIKAMQPIAYLSVYATIALYPFVRAGMTRRELKSVDLHAMERAYDVLGQRPRDPMARFRLAQTAWTLGMTGHALRIGESCLPELDSKVFREEHMIVKRWHREMIPAEMFVDYPCTVCGNPCPAGRTHCPSCGEPFLLNRAKGKLFDPRMARKLIAAWVAGAGALAGVPWATTLAPAAAIGAIIVILGLAFLVVFLAFRPQGQPA
jgi:hypothetical protein